MSKPRTPEHFPHMKVRGGRRRRDAQIAQTWRGMRAIDWSAIGRVFDGMAGALTKLGTAVVRVRLIIGASFHMAMLRQHNAWVATHQLPVKPSPYALPIHGGQR